MTCPLCRRPPARTHRCVDQRTKVSSGYPFRFGTKFAHINLLQLSSLSSILYLLLLEDLLFIEFFVVVCRCLFMIDPALPLEPSFPVDVASSCHFLEPVGTSHIATPTRFLHSKRQRAHLHPAQQSGHDPQLRIGG